MPLVDVNIRSVADPSEGLVKVGKHEFTLPEVPKWKYYKDGKLEFEGLYDYAGDFRSGFAPVKSSDKWGYINKYGRIAIPLLYESADEFSEGFAAVQIASKYGFVDKTGKLVIPPQFDKVVSPFRCGVSYVTKGNYEGYINTKGLFIWKVKRTGP